MEWGTLLPPEAPGRPLSVPMLAPKIDKSIEYFTEFYKVLLTWPAAALAASLAAEDANKIWNNITNKKVQLVCNKLTKSRSANMSRPRSEQEWGINHHINIMMACAYTFHFHFCVNLLFLRKMGIFAGSLYGSFFCDQKNLARNMTR